MPASHLVGRDRDLALIRALIDQTRTDGGALLVFGEPGVGKSALLEAAMKTAMSGGTRVLSAQGVEFEAEVPFAGVNQVLLPLFGGISELSDDHQEALNVALGFRQGRPHDRLVVSTAALMLLRRAAAECPILIVVDDLPWLDRASGDVLGFISRRLAGSHLGFLAASRTGEESFFERAGLARHDLQALDPESASRLMSARFPDLVRRVRERVLVEAQGNPLALLELPSVMSDSALPSSGGISPVVPVTRRLQALFASRVSTMPGGTRRLLLAAALDGTGDLRVLRRVEPGGNPSDDLAPAEGAGLAYVDRFTHRLEFRHSLIRSTVVELSGSEERRRAHLGLADLWADHPDRRAWHLAEAAEGPNEQVAEQLEHAAYRVLRRGDGVGAVSMLTRAAELSPGGDARGRRLAEAAYLGGDVAGQLDRASQLLADAHRADAKFTETLQAAATAGFVLLNGDGNVEMAHRLLVAAIEGSDAVGGTALEEALNVLALVCFFGGREEMWAPFHSAVERCGQNLSTTLYLISTCFADPIYRAVPALPRLEQAIAELATEADPTVILKVAFAAGNTDRLPACRQALWRVAHGRDAGAIGSAIQALVVLAFESWHTGRWEQAAQLADEALELCHDYGFPLFAFSVRHAQAALAAARGDDDGVQAIVDAMLQWAAPRGAGFVRTVSCHVRGLAALGRCEFEEAYRLAATISPAGTLRSHELMVQWVMMDLVEAAVHIGRRDEAAAHVAAMHEADVDAVSSRAALLVSGATAMAAPDESAIRLFETAISSRDAERWPFYLARVQLAYGERLRRMRLMADSRVHLSSALRTFERLGATPWGARAAGELRASGLSKARGDRRDSDALTPQELEIAGLAATGLTNKQIGERLFLSHRTVGFHLHRIFPKLGIASRAALRDALEASARRSAGHMTEERPTSSGDTHGPESAAPVPERHRSANHS